MAAHIRLTAMIRSVLMILLCQLICNTRLTAEGEWSLPLSKGPRNSPVIAAADHRGRCVDEIRNEFEVTVVGPILPVKRKLQVGQGLPMNAAVERRIAGNIQAGQLANVSDGQLQIDMLGKVERRPKI